MREGWTIRNIKRAVRNGRLKQPFRAADVNSSLGIDYAGVFLPQRCEGNPDRKLKLHFVRVSCGLYQLK
jgi:hypothetical protein